MPKVCYTDAAYKLRKLERKHERLRSRHLNVVNDMCDVREKCTRTTAQSVEMLRDALDALQHGHLHVTEEFLTREIKKLAGVVDALRTYN